MNENIDLTKILKDCPKGWEFYSSNVGNIRFVGLKLEDPDYPIIVRVEGRRDFNYTKEGWYWKDYPDAECTLFPSKDQRDWSKFSAPWYKKEKFDPKTLQPFDKVLVKIGSFWQIELFSHIWKNSIECQYQCARSRYDICIPYNNDTKYLVGTNKKAPEYYKYWED